MAWCWAAAVRSFLCCAAAGLLVASSGCSGQTPANMGSGGSSGAAGSGGAPVGTGGGSGASGSGGTGGSGGTAGAGGTGNQGGSSSEPDSGTGDSGAVTSDTAGDRAPGTTDAPTTACAPGALLCEDFERYAAGGSLAPTWTTDTTGGTIVVDGTRPFAGGKGLHITAPANTSSMLQIVKAGAPLFPVANNTFYGRMMMWLTQMPTGTVHFNTVQANGLLPGTTRIAKYAYGAMYARLMAGYTVRLTETALPQIDCGKSGPTGYPEKAWVCAEWKFDGPNNEMHYWLNGQAQTGVDVVKVGGGCTGTQPAGGLWQAPVFDKLMLGWYSQPFTAPVELWIDDVVVGTEKIGCPTPP